MWNYAINIGWGTSAALAQEKQTRPVGINPLEEGQPADRPIPAARNAPWPADARPL